MRFSPSLGAILPYLTTDREFTVSTAAVEI